MQVTLDFMDSILIQVFIYLLAAVISVPLAHRLGLGSVLGYLIAGVLIGPVIGLVGSETTSLQHFAEFGVVMMLFLVGLELEPRALWSMRGRLLGLGVLQVLLTTAAVAVIAYLLGQPLKLALGLGFVLSLSSTAIVLQTLNEKGLMKSEGGQASFSVLLFQDIAVIPMLALLPFLAMPGATETLTHGADGHGSGINLVAGLPAWLTGLVTLGAIALVIVGGHYLMRPMFRFIAQSGLREIFTAAALLLVIAIALLMSMVGLSAALGTFLAGVVLATSEYRHELESDIEPFKGLLLGLFFITVGAGINFDILFSNFGIVILITVGVILLKALVLFVLSLIFKIKGSDQWLFFLSLAQAGEFGFVLISFCLQNNVIPVYIADILLLVVALSMLMTPALFIFFEKIVQPRLLAGQTLEHDEIDEKGTVIIAGHGRFGQVINRLLLSNGFKTVVLDIRADTTENLRAFKVKTFYGDATRPDLLHAAGLQEAKLLVVAIDDYQQALELIAYARRERPDLHIIARAFDRLGVYKLYQSGTNDIVRETFDSAVRAGRYALEALGLHPIDAEKAATMYVDMDRKGIRELAEVYDPKIPVARNKEYIARALKIKDELDAAMSGNSELKPDHSERG